MSRNASGTMIAVNGPYTPATTILSAIINARLADIETEITGSLSRNNLGAMLAILRLINGTNAAPSLTFDGDTDTGIYRAAANDLRITLGGVDFLSSAALTFPVAATIKTTGTDAILFLAGNLSGANASVDVSIHSSVARSAGSLLAVQNGDPNSIGAAADRLFVDYHGLLSLASGAAAAALQPAGMVTALTPNVNVTANGCVYWKDACGMVHLEGAVTNATGGPIQNLVTTTPLPAGFRGTANMAAISTVGPCQVSVLAGTGAITTAPAIANGNQVFFDGLSFRATA